MVYDKERITKIIKDIERLFADLEDSDIRAVNELKNKEKFYSVSMMLFSIINRTIDFGDEIVASKNIGVPSTYKEIFLLLGKNKLIPSGLAKKLSELVYYRNLLSHEYYSVTEKDVFDIFNRIYVVKEFISKIKLLLKNEKRN